MQMIDLMKRLAELDAQNPNLVHESDSYTAEDAPDSMSEGLNECGMMGEMGHSHTPASISMTAASGEELSGMLKDIMSLAGVKSADTGIDRAPDALVTEPVDIAEPVLNRTEIMRSMIDKLNPAGDDETDEGLDNEPDPSMYGDVPANQDPAGHPGVGDRMDGDRPKAFATFEESLMAEYKKFISEDQGETGVTQFANSNLPAYIGRVRDTNIQSRLKMVADFIEGSADPEMKFEAQKDIAYAIGQALEGNDPTQVIQQLKSKLRFVRKHPGGLHNDYDRYLERDLKTLAQQHSQQGVAEGNEPELGTVKAYLMNTKTPTVQVQVFKHNTLRGDSYWVTKEVRKFKTMDQAQAYIDRINKQDVAEGNKQRSK